ncbi:hypothetical protein BJV82DRAFT_614598 [Fennellomyces sp. T-0311]|nr:hypothetical protein BJV82DRAFT_614598 [Fennellomyces sp. T-0311]
MSLFAEQQPSNIHSSQQPRRRSSAEIRGQSVSSDVLVALLDRPQEMRILASRNPHFYLALENYITETQGLDAWVQFQDIAYAPREDLPDRDWMAAIAKFLSQNPVFLTKFKESVGYFDEDDGDSQATSDEEEIATSSGGEDEFATMVREHGYNEDAPPPRRKSSQLMHPALVVTQPPPPPPRPVLLTLRDYPDIQTRLPLMCPAFFRMARQRMAGPPASKRNSVHRRNSILEDDFENGEGEEHLRFSFCDQEESYENFVDAVCATRHNLPDDQIWLRNVAESLDGYPELLDDLREIAVSLEDDH